MPCQLCLCGPLGFCFKYEAYVEEGMVYTSESCVVHFEAGFIRGFRECVHAPSFCFGYSPTRRAKRS